MTFSVGRGGVAVDLSTASLRPRQLRLVRVRLMAGKGKGRVGARGWQGLEVKRQWYVWRWPAQGGQGNKAAGTGTG